MYVGNQVATAVGAKAVEQGMMQLTDLRSLISTACEMV